MTPDEQAIEIQCSNLLQILNNPVNTPRQKLSAIIQCLVLMPRYDKLEKDDTKEAIRLLRYLGDNGIPIHDRLEAAKQMITWRFL